MSAPTWGRMDIRLPNGSVALRMSTDGCAIVSNTWRRRWWWPWRPRLVSEQLAHTDFTPKTGDIVTFAQVGGTFTVTVKDDAGENVVLRYPKEPPSRYRGFGMKLS